MKTFFYISALVLGISYCANATIQTKINPDKPSEVVMTTANGSSVFHYDYYTTTTFTWNWNATNGGNYSMVMLPDGLQDGLNIYDEDYDKWDTSGTGPYEDWEVIYRGNNPPDRRLVDSGTNSYWGFPWEIGSLSDVYDPPWGYLTKNSKVTIQLRTGGKGGSKLSNLFGLQANATGYRHLALSSYDYLTPELSDSYTISPTSIQVAGHSLNTNGIAYAIFPDNSTVDITPKTAEKYYSFGVSAQKYHSYFEVFVDQPNPGTTYTYSDTAGHAFWQFKTDAPAEAIQYISPILTTYLNHSWGFYPHGANCGLPGQLGNDDSHGKDVTRVFYIGFNDLIGGLQFTRGISNAPPEYCFAVWGYSCVGATTDSGRSAGITLPTWWNPLNWMPQNFGAAVVLKYPGPLDDETPRYSN